MRSNLFQVIKEKRVLENGWKGRNSMYTPTIRPAFTLQMLGVTNLFWVENSLSFFRII